MTEKELANLVEFSEARAYRSLIGAASPQLARECGFRVVSLASAIAVMADSVKTSLNFNRVIGLGVAEPATEELVDSACDLYRSSGVPYGFEISPACNPDALTDWLRSRGLRKAFASAILYREDAPPESIYDSWTRSTGLRVERTGEDLASVLGEICSENFRMPSSVGALLGATIHQPGWRHWVAFDREQPIGASLSYVEGDVCWLGWTCVSPSHRGRWVHAGIVAQEISDAIRADCRWITTETALGSATAPDPAYYNLRRFGFRDAYSRPIFARKVPASC